MTGRDAAEVTKERVAHYFHTEETDAQLTTLSSGTLALMFGTIRPLGDMLTTLPVGPDHPDLNAGPSFELFYESDHLMPQRAAAWTLLDERLRVAAGFCGKVRESAPDPLAKQLAPVGEALTGVAVRAALSLSRRLS
jgi:hypothetical protein